MQTTPHRGPDKAAGRSSFRAFLRGDAALSPQAARLLLVVYALLLLSRLIDNAFLTRSGAYLSTVLLQLLIFPIPAYLYIVIRGKKLSGRLRLRSFPLSHAVLVLAAILVLIGGCTLLAMLCGMMRAQASFTLYDTFSSVHDGSAGSTVRLILTYALIPAFCEELVFRSILCAEYEEPGILFSSVVSALFFAFLHFDLTALPVYLFAGFILAVVLYITRSAIASMLVHLGYNLFGVFAQAGISGYCRSTGNVGLLVVVLVALLLIASGLFCAETARVLRRRGTSPLPETADEVVPGLCAVPAPAFFRLLGRVFLCPEAIAAVILWIVGVVLNLTR